MSINSERTFTLELTNDTLDIASNDGILQVDITCTTGTSGTVQGDPAMVVGGKTSTPITVATGSPVTIAKASPNGHLSDIHIVAPSGCTLLVVAQR